MKLSTETWVCSVKGHVTPAADVAQLGPEEAGLGIHCHPRWRFSRCLRCDAWIGGPPPDLPLRDRLPALEELELPRRGKALRQAVILRLIAIDRGFHAVAFGVIAILAFLLRANLAGIQGNVHTFLDTLTQTEAQTGRVTNHGILAREGTRILHLKSGTLEVLIITAAIYALVEGAEAVGLWRERRWAEYLTALATAGFLPLEVHELTKRVTALRVGALIINVAILIYLVYAKHLFGVHSARARDKEAETEDRSVFSPPF